MIDILRIKEFASKYGLDRRTVDYWTNIGLLHPKISENGYRDYTDHTDHEIRSAIVASMIDRPGSLEEKYEAVKNLEHDDWKTVMNEIIDKRKKLSKLFNVAYMTAYRRSNGEE